MAALSHGFRGAPSPGSAVELADGLFGRLFRRLSGRYLDFLLTCAASSIAGLALVTAAFALPFLNLSASEYWGSMLVVFPWMALVGGVAEWRVGRGMRPLREWLVEGRHSEAAPIAWEAAVTGLARTVLVGGSIVIVGSVPASLFVAANAGASGSTQLGVVIVVWAFIAAGGALHYLLWERALRPVVLALAEQLPPGFKSERRSLTLGGKLLMLIPVMNLISAIAAYSLASGVGGPGGQVVIGLMVALIATGSVSIPLTMMLRRSLLTPINHLLRAMGRVERGDLEARLPVVSADEIGTVAQHFNSMLGGLHERERYASQNVLLTEDLKASRARIVAASHEARRNVERDLHDGAQQNLVLLNLKLGLAETRVVEDPETAAAILADAREELTRALGELRDLAHGIYPQVLTSDGLGAAIEEAVAASGLRARLESGGIAHQSPETEAAVYFCCLEALQNAAKHAADAEVVVRLAEAEGNLLFEVADDGGGFDPESVNGSAGLQNMSDRIGALGGELRIESAAGKGVRIVGSVPLG